MKEGGQRFCGSRLHLRLMYNDHGCAVLCPAPRPTYRNMKFSKDCTLQDEVHLASEKNWANNWPKNWVRQHREHIRSALTALSCCWARSAAPLASALSLLIAAAFNVRTCKTSTVSSMSHGSQNRRLTDSKTVRQAPCLSCTIMMHGNSSTPNLETELAVALSFV